MKPHNWFYDGFVLRHPRLTPKEKLILGIVLNYHKKDGCKCGNKYLGEQVGLTPEATRQTVRTLREKGFLAPNQIVFGQKFEGSRLIPTGLCYEQGVLKSHTPRDEITHPSVMKSHTDINNTLIDIERERERATPHSSSQSPEALRKNLLEVTEKRGVPVGDAQRIYDRELTERTASGTANLVQNWPALIKAAYQAEQKALKADRGSAKNQKSQFRPPPVSQFSQFSGQN